MPSRNLTLKHFILKLRVLSLYRRSIRATKSISHPTTRKETIAWIRSEYERNKHLTDTSLIEEKLNVARKEIKEILPNFH
ncbi:hypothetical protein BDQ17DRAFT_34475 [Cyathus striatus]|nr:hypothetical protein BDQ17DRAFT_34475 [Cyathus striatus]